MRSLLEGTDRYDNTPLHVAALNGNFGAVKVLLESLKFNVNRDRQSATSVVKEKLPCQYVLSIIVKIAKLLCTWNPHYFNFFT